MTTREEIVGFLDELLDSADFPDYGPNGLQVPGSQRVSRVVTAVSATRELFEMASERSAEAVLVHHGLFWGESGALGQVQADRLRALLCNDLNLIAYHLPLDAHPEVGNNALLIRELGMEVGDPLGSHKGRSIGYIANCSDLAPGELTARITERLDRAPLHLPHGPDRIERVGVIAGSAPDYIVEAAAAGCDAFITGEPAERVNALAKELNIHFYAAGHHATERLGVQSLGRKLEERFGLAHEFIEVPNPI